MEVLCEVNGIPVLCRSEGGDLEAPEGLEGIAAYFEARGTPEDVYGGDVRARLAARGITERREQNRELWKMAHDLLYGPLAEIFDELEEDL